MLRYFGVSLLKALKEGLYFLIKNRHELYPYINDVLKFMKWSTLSKQEKDNIKAIWVGTFICAIIMGFVLAVVSGAL